MDRISPAHRSWNMSQIKGRDTLPERRVRSIIHRLGFRFSLRRKDLPGRPDIVLTRYQIAVFVHGCFWHRHKRCAKAVMPKTRPEFWAAKLNGNVERGRRNTKELKKRGWQVLTIWECEAQDESRLATRLAARLIPLRHD
jgi:DNA mismatch endonuclease (patch repair protein)